MTAKPKHTPWLATRTKPTQWPEGYDILIKDSRGWVIAEVPRHFEPLCSDADICARVELDQAAHARLMAAAPDLARTLAAMLACSHGEGEDCQHRRAARAALAKAGLDT